MSFFDRKQDVLDIELTPYGKYLLSQGKFKPVYYSFMDSDIIYDTKHTGITENQNEIHERIVNSVRTKVQNRFANSQSGNLDQELKIASFDREYSYGVPLGTSTPDDSLPSWEVRVLKGEISNSSLFITGTLGNVNIPQITLKDICVKTKPIKSEDDGFAPVFGEDPGFDLEGCNLIDELSPIFRDGTTFNTIIDSVILEVKENNVPLDKENFQIEIFEEKEGSLIPLNFTKDPERVVEGILLEEEQLQNVNFDEFGTSDSEFYFDLQFDNDIEELQQENKEKRNRFVSDLYDFPRIETQEC